MKDRSARAAMGLLGILSLTLGVALIVYIASFNGVLGAVIELVRPAGTPSSPLERGSIIYQEKCASCHGGPTGGSIADYPPRHNASGHTWQHGDCDLAQTIRTGRVPGGDVFRATPPPSAISMPAFADRLNDEEVSAVIDFIKTMWTPEQRAAQAGMTKGRCGAS